MKKFSKKKLRQNVALIKKEKEDKIHHDVMLISNFFLKKVIKRSEKGFSKYKLNFRKIPDKVSKHFKVNYENWSYTDNQGLTSHQSIFNSYSKESNDISFRIKDLAQLVKKELIKQGYKAKMASYEEVSYNWEEKKKKKKMSKKDKRKEKFLEREDYYNR